MSTSYLSELQPSARLLLGPGPSSVHPRVLQAMTLPVMGHLDPDFFQVMNDIGDMLREVYRTTNVMTMPVSATGTGAMETACVNILEPGDTFVVCRNGYFGIRLGNIAGRCGAIVHEVDTPWGSPVDPQALDDELSRHPKVKAVGVVHAETSTGVLTPLPDILEVIHRHGALAIVDAVTSLGGHDMRVDEWCDRRVLQRHPEVPGRPSGPGAHHPQRVRHAGGEDPGDPGAELLLQLAGPGELLGPVAQLPPHRAHFHDLRSARGAAHDDGRGHREPH